MQDAECIFCRIFRQMNTFSGGSDMDKELLYQYMRVKFREAGFSRAEIELHMQSFAERYQNKTEE